MTQSASAVQGSLQDSRDGRALSGFSSCACCASSSVVDKLALRLSVSSPSPSRTSQKLFDSSSVASFSSGHLSAEAVTAAASAKIHCSCRFSAAPHKSSVWPHTPVSNCWPVELPTHLSWKGSHRRLFALFTERHFVRS